MRALIMMLFNVKKNTYHPILYFEKPLHGNPDHLIRYKSAGHRTSGFKNVGEAIESIETEIIGKLDSFEINKELDVCLPWDGVENPADVQIRQC